MIIGLDISTSIVGIALLREDQSIAEVHHVDLRKVNSENYCEMADMVFSVLSKIKEDYPAEDFKIFIEEAGKKFAKGTSSASTIFKLARFNGIVSYTCYKIFGISPIELDARNARKSIGLIIPPSPKGTKYSDKKKKTKEAVIDFLIKECKYTPEEMGFEKTNKDNWQVWCGDRADAIVIAKSGVAAN